MEEFIYDSNSLEETRAVSGSLAQAIREQAKPTESITICLDGELGAGKTTFSSGFCQGLGVPADAISSPTFSLANVYQCDLDSHPLTIHHFDFYRISDEDELFETGFEETVNSAGVHLIEWSNKFGESLPLEKILVSFRTTGVSNRRISMKANSKELQILLQRAKSAVSDKIS